jgi:hypothetical protein
MDDEGVGNIQGKDREDDRRVLTLFHAEIGLVELHVRLASRRLRTGVVTPDDMRSLAREGLLRAARTFDAGRGVPFRFWAHRRIKGAIATACGGGTTRCGCVAFGAGRPAARLRGAVTPRRRGAFAGGVCARKPMRLARASGTSARRLRDPAIKRWHDPADGELRRERGVGSPRPPRSAWAGCGLEEQGSATTVRADADW